VDGISKVLLRHVAQLGDGGEVEQRRRGGSVS
jgi:hypothetical protein